MDSRPLKQHLEQGSNADADAGAYEEGRRVHPSWRGVTLPGQARGGIRWHLGAGTYPSHVAGLIGILRTVDDRA